MALAWISGVFRRFVRFLADNLDENQHVSTNEVHSEASGMGSYSPAEAGGTHSQSLDNEYWREATHSQSFDNEYWREATHSQSFDNEYRKEAARSELFDNEYRRNAQKHAESRAECFAEADEARKSGDHATANAYVRQANEHTQKMNEANKNAVEYIMRINPNNKKPNTIDLHGLRVEEAMEQTEKKLRTSQGKLRIIPGRGSHSVNQQAKIKPKLIELLRNLNFSFTEENAGSFIVTIP